MDKIYLDESDLHRFIKESAKRYIKENFFNENGFDENAYLEAKKKSSKKKDKKEDNDKDKSTGDNMSGGMKKKLLKWLKAPENKDSVISYNLFHPKTKKEKDNVRSKYAKKLQGHDSNGNEYDFTSSELNKLYDMMGDYMDGGM